jgi:YidC/Oxa1 family membrane protein insertase
LIVLMSLTSFLTQRQVMTKNMPPSAGDSPFAQQQKMLLYVFPLIFAISGVNFPIGVLIYWLTTNLWSMGQQFYVITFNPTPGSPAAIALEERRKRRAAHKGRDHGSGSRGTAGTPSAGSSAPASTPGDAGIPGDDRLAKVPPAAEEAARRSGQRQQPRRRPRKR